MIFEISYRSFTTWDESKRYCLLLEMANHHHFILCDHEVRKDIRNHFDQSDLSLLKKMFDITDEQKTFLTLVDTANFTLFQLFSLVREKSRVLIENAPYEWPIYEKLIKLYCKDPNYGNVIDMVRLAIERNDLYCLHGGGVSTYVALVNMEEKHCYNYGIFAMKHVIVFDRDTDSSNDYDPNQNALFGKMCGKDYLALLEADVYSLTQQPYVWHVWYKRAIENYFSNEEYENLGVKTYNVPVDPYERDYCKMNDTLVGYHKRLMSTIANKTDRKKFDGRQKKFSVIDSQGNSYSLSEFQLLFLKIARII